MHNLTCLTVNICKILPNHGSTFQSRNVYLPRSPMNQAHVSSAIFCPLIAPPPLLLTNSSCVQRTRSLSGWSPTCHLFLAQISLLFVYQMSFGSASRWQRGAAKQNLQSHKSTDAQSFVQPWAEGPLWKILKLCEEAWAPHLNLNSSFTMIIS